MNIERRKTVNVRVGDVLIGSDYPIVVQSMTNTDTEDAVATAGQIAELAKAGSEIVRITVNTDASGSKIKEIKQRLADMGVSVPIVGDFHYNGHKILANNSDCRIHLDKYRINPGNVGSGVKKDEQFAYMIQTAIEYDKPVRIGVNWGSLDPALLATMMDDNSKLVTPLDSAAVMRDALVESAVQSARRAMDLGLSADKIVLSCKVSKVQDLILVYSDLASRCDFPLHLGLTEAGMGIKGITASSIGIGHLLQMGIGDTIRVSLTPKPGGSRTEEVKVAQEILQSMELRAFTPTVTACPGCGRTSSDYFQHLAEQIQGYLDVQMPLWRKTHIGAESLHVAVMGCVVNGPGESKLANIGISLPGRDESPVAPVFIDGKRAVTLKGDKIAEEFQAIVDDYVQSNYAKL